MTRKWEETDRISKTPLRHGLSCGWGGNNANVVVFYSSNNDRWDIEFIAFVRNQNLHRDDDDVLSEVHRGLLCLSVSIKALAASFESGSSVLYTLQEPLSGILNEETRRSPAGFHDAEVTKSQEKVSFGFLTHHVPALILTAHTVGQHYMAVMLTSNGTKSYITLHQGWGKLIMEGRCLAPTLIKHTWCS